MTFNDQGEVLGANGDAVIRDENVLEDVATVQRIAKAAEPLQTIHEKIVAQAASEIVGARAECRAGECTTMFFLISDAMFDSVKDQGVQIAIQNSGGIRASLDAGKVIMGEVLTVLPFQNTLSTFEVSGAILLAALKMVSTKSRRVQAGFYRLRACALRLIPKLRLDSGRQMRRY